MNILVTGGAGYIGSITVELLLQQGHNVIVIDNLKEGHREAVLSQAIFYEGNYGDKALLSNTFKKHNIQIVIHFAADASVPISMKDPSPFFNNNVANGIVLLDTMREFNCNKIIFSSTAATFGEPKYTPIDEKHVQKPINAYGDSKLMFEHILKWYHRSYGLQVNIFRYFCAAGASETLGEAHKNESHLIPLAILTAMKKKDKLFIYGNDYTTKDGTCIRDFIHVLDIAQAHILAINNLEKRPFEHYNLGNGKGYTVQDVIDTVEKVTNSKLNVEIIGRRLGDPAILIASFEKAKKHLGWTPKYDIKQIIESAYKWHLNQKYE